MDKKNVLISSSELRMGDISQKPGLILYRTCPSFLLFTMDQYYPGGGFDDYAGKFSTLKEAKKAAKKYLKNNGACCNYHIVNLDTLEIIERGGI